MTPTEAVRPVPTTTSRGVANELGRILRAILDVGEDKTKKATALAIITDQLEVFVREESVSVNKAMADTIKANMKTRRVRSSMRKVTNKDEPPLGQTFGQEIRKPLSGPTTHKRINFLTLREMAGE